jgi:hypothetical protein
MTHPFNCTEASWNDYIIFFSGICGNSLSENATELFLKSSLALFKNQLNLLIFYYVTVIIEALFVGFLCFYYGTIKRFRFIGQPYKFLAEKFLVRNLSEWHRLLTSFEFPRKDKTKVYIDVLLETDQLYQGEVSYFHIDDNGNLTGILISDALRFDRKKYVDVRSKNIQISKKSFWKKIPGKNLYISADKISSINFKYESDLPTTITEINKELINLEQGITYKIDEIESDEETFTNSNKLYLNIGPL